MSITYINELNQFESNKKYAIIDLDDLYLDVNNPRFSSTTLIANDKSATQQDIISYLLRFGKLLELTNSIEHNNNLYSEEWLSCAINSNGHIVVLEGNRRIAACKIMCNPELIPENLRENYKLGHCSIQTIHNIQKIKVVIYNDEKDAQNYISAKHIQKEIKSWEVVEQCNYYYSQFNNGKPISDISANSGDDISSVQTKIKQFGIFKEIFNVVTEKYPDIIVEEVTILPLATKFFPPIASKNKRIGLNLNYDKDKLRYFPLPEKADIYKKILLLIGEAFFVRSKGVNVDLDDRLSSDKYRISTNEIKSQKQVETLIVDNIRIPGLLQLIQAYKEVIPHETPNEVAVSKEDTSQSDEETTSTKTDTMPPTPPVQKERTVSSDKVPEFFSDLNYEHLSPIKHPGLYAVCKEIKLISTYNSGAGYKQFPISATFLLRSLIEQTLGERLKQKDLYEKRSTKNGYQRSPELDSMISIYLKYYTNGNYQLFWDDSGLGCDFNKCFSGHGTKDQLDTVIHNPQNIYPEQNFLNSLANQGLKSVIQAFLDNL